MKTIKQLEQEVKQAREDGFSITESQLSLLRDVFDYDDEWLMRHISIKLLGHRNIVLEIDHINDCDYKELEAWQEVSGDGSGESLLDDSNGWIKWHGVGRPHILAREKIEARFANGDINNGEADQYRLAHVGSSDDIIDYRIVKGE